MKRDPETCLAYWYPKLEAADLGINLPKTLIVDTCNCQLDLLLNGDRPIGFDDFLDRVKAAIEQIGLPCFLRTGMTSGKHGWQETCYLTDISDLESHVSELVEYSACCDMLGLPTDVWVVRELLNTNPAFYAFSGVMPVTKERRYFVRDGLIEHHQPYWDPKVIAGHTTEPDWKTKLREINEEFPDEIELLSQLTQQVSLVIPGYWSIDWLWTTDRGWFLIDMAEGQKSYKYEA